MEEIMVCLFSILLWKRIEVAQNGWVICDIFILITLICNVHQGTTYSEFYGSYFLVRSLMEEKWK
jgi:hypothetical protein